MSIIDPVALPPAAFGGARIGTKYDREYAAFRRMLPALMQTHFGQYVAIHDEQVVASGADRLQVVNEALANAGNVAIHVGLVGPNPMPASRSGLLRDMTIEARMP